MPATAPIEAQLGHGYRVPGPAVVNFSGGRSSGYMLRNILDAWDGELPGDVLVIFCNTGKERPETLNFVHDCETRWAVPITWLEYRYRTWAAGGRAEPKNTFEIVDHNSASRDGKPFDDLLTERNYLPNPVQRACTEELKVNTVRRYIRAHYGWRKFRNVLGIRHDEPKRWGRILTRDCDALLPMVEAGATRADVANFWRRSPFDLGIDSSLGNCDLCFLKATELLVDTIRGKPELADWWIAQEARVRLQRDTVSGQADATFRRGRRYADLVALARKPRDPTLFDQFADGELDDCNCTD